MISSTKISALAIIRHYSTKLEVLHTELLKTVHWN